jgi:uncharacterized protein (DUF4415 family)
MNTSRASSKAPKGAPDPEAIGELGDDFFAQARIRKGDRVIREASATMARRGRPPKAAGEKKEAVSIRLSPEVLAHFRAGGEGWQTRIDETLKDFVRSTVEGAASPGSRLGDPDSSDEDRPKAWRSGDDVYVSYRNAEGHLVIHALVQQVISTAGGVETQVGTLMRDLGTGRFSAETANENPARRGSGKQRA